MEQIEVIIADDHQLFVDCLKEVLNMSGEFSVAGTANNGQELLDLLPANPEALVMLDINMPVMDGLQAMQKIHHQFPKCKVLGVSMFRNPDVIRKMLHAGAKGYITKNCPHPELVKALRAVASGQLYCSQEVMEQLHDSFRPDHNTLAHDESDGTKVQSLTSLSLREKEVLQLIMQGKTNVEIGDKLFISPRTVAAHRTNLLRKTGAKNSAELVKYAMTSELAFN